MLRYLFWIFGVPSFCMAGDLNDPPINYAKTQAENPITALQAKLDAGKVQLKQTSDHGYLESVLKALDVPVSSQVFVFSKTSFQLQRITPRTPRAIYFNDDMYVGFCLRGDVLEFSVADGKLGTAFYSLDQDPTEPVKFIRQTDSCLNCHGSTRNQGYPGHLVRSVFPDRFGMPILSQGSTHVTHSTPLEDRWGGWYVTGTHGKIEHRGNWVIQDKKNPDKEDRKPNQNVVDLKDRFTASAYLSPHSDLMALMVLEHQGEMHNRLARANLVTREALYYRDRLNKELKENPDHQWESVTRRIETVGEEVVQYMLFCEEAKLDDAIDGTSGFRKEFEGRGPKDAKGRSLRQFDAKTRLFRYPCSYLIYSQAFLTLPNEVKSHIIKRLDFILSGSEKSEKYAHLNAADRKAIREILSETHPMFKAWK